MAEAPPVRPQNTPPPDVGGGTGLNTRLGPLPYWAWGALVIAGAVVGWTWYRSRSSNKGDSSSQSQMTNQGATAEGLSTEQYESLLSLLRDIQGQPSTPIYSPGDPGTGTGIPSPANTPTAPQEFQMSVGAGQKVESFVSAVDARRGRHVPWAAIEARNMIGNQNPVSLNINWVKDPNARTFKRAATYTIPATWTQT